MFKRLRSAPISIAAAAAASGCTVHQTDVPGLTGPSEYALSIGVPATPDIVTQDGASQAAIVVLARDANGRPVPSLPLRLDMEINGTLQDFGTLSARNLVTNADGRATTTFTAPPAPPVGASGS